MMKRLLNWIGDWNPQLLREWQGRFKPWNVVGAFALSAVAQFFFLSGRRSTLPYPGETSHPFCTEPLPRPDITYPPNNLQCLKDAAGEIIVNWQLWWHDVFVPLTQVLVFALIVAGVYLLISDLIYEERRGTLNFVRLSPRSGREILVGKLLGVPILIYVGLATAMPLHLYAAVQGQVPWEILAGTYIIGAMSTLFFFSGALLWSVTTSALGYFQPWLGGGFAAFTLTGLMSVTPANESSTPLRWLLAFDPTVILRYLSQNANYKSDLLSSTFLSIPYYASVGSAIVFTVGFLGVWIYWIWQALDRRFRNPIGTALSKKQSYGFTACLVGSLVGFTADAHIKEYLFLTILGMSMVMCMVVITLITPNRQTLQEWVRYRSKAPRKSLFSELLWGEKSPALLAVAVNLGIMLALLMPLVFIQWYQADQMMARMIVFAIALLLVAAIFQTMLMSKVARPALWAAGSWGLLLFLPAMISALFGSQGIDTFWLFSTAPWMAIGQVPLVTVVMGMMAQVGVLSLLTYRLTRQLNRAGASESKALLKA